ncbi:MAG: hypothetical protein LBT89_01590 [Planctomycetaceae bacterium]|jgi:hypothetical protein|nr:hypothetical protein [Planctomycetaceae bacterium]
MMKHFVTITLLLPLLLLAAGCNNYGLKGLSPVKGTIMSNGTPLEGVIVSCFPVTPTSEARTATARSAADGTFALTTLKPNDGAFPGEYRVALSKNLASMTFRQVQELGGLGIREPRVDTADAVPEKYRNAETSGLTLTVKAGRNPVWQIDVPEGLEEITFDPKSSFEAQKPK